ncbi:MAG: CPXCG motif-containing cysteine-rich protein [Candidatus Thiodiazotropha sp.]
MPTTPPHAMDSLDEHTIYCPYCGETLEVLIDAEEIGQRYIEDCQVCCRPISFSISSAADGSLAVAVYREDDA